jgi:hypothetical protein
MSGGGWETPGGPQQQGPWGQPQFQQESNGKAITALVLGICGLVVCPVLLSIPALILGYQARGEIDGSGGRQSGRGMAVAGIVLGWIGIAVGVIGIIFIVLAIAAGESGEFDFETTSDDPVSAITFAVDALSALGALL